MKLSTKAQSRKRQISELDGLLRSVVLARDEHTCNWCGQSNRHWERPLVLQSAHVLSKGPASRLRFEPDNLMTLCVACHLFKWHRSPHEAVAWFNEKYPGRYERLQIAARCAPKVDIQLLLTIWRAEVAKL